MMCATGVQLNAKNASLSAMESITRWMSASVSASVKSSSEQVCQHVKHKKKL
jgi:hypothetical protein